MPADKKLTFDMSVSDALESFDIEKQVETEFDREYPSLKDDKKPDLPEGLRTAPSVKVGEVLTNLTTWYEDVVQPDAAKAERRMQAAKGRMDTVEAALRMEYMRTDPELKKSGRAGDLTASIKSDRRYVATSEEYLIKQAVFDHMERRAKAWRRSIDTVSRIITQQTDDEWARRMGGRPDAVRRSPQHPFRSRQQRSGGSSES